MDREYKTYDFYLITNICTNRHYVGVTTLGYENRIYCHYHSNDDCELHVDMRNNPENFRHCLLKRVESKNKNAMLRLESYYIGLYNAYENGYNKNIGFVNNFS